MIVRVILFQLFKEAWGNNFITQLDYLDRVSGLVGTKKPWTRFGEKKRRSGEKDDSTFDLS